MDRYEVYLETQHGATIASSTDDCCGELRVHARGLYWDYCACGCYFPRTCRQQGCRGCPCFTEFRTWEYLAAAGATFKQVPTTSPGTVGLNITMGGIKYIFAPMRSQQAAQISDAAETMMAKFVQGPLHGAEVEVFGLVLAQMPNPATGECEDRNRNQPNVAVRFANGTTGVYSRANVRRVGGAATDLLALGSPLDRPVGIPPNSTLNAL